MNVQDENNNMEYVMQKQVAKSYAGQHLFASTGSQSLCLAASVL